MYLRESVQLSSSKKVIAIATLFALAVSMPGSFAADEIATSQGSAPSGQLLEGKTEKTHIILEDSKLYQVAMKAMKDKDYADALRYLQMLTPQLDKSGYEPYLAEVKYYEADCHKNLQRMRAALDTYNKAYELFTKYDSSNPLKLKAWKEYEKLRAMQGRLDSNQLQANVQSNQLRARIKKRNIMLELQKAEFAINPNVTLKGNNNDVILRCNDQRILPHIVNEVFAGMSCLETAEIGSNVTNAVDRWMPLKVAGRTAAFAVSNRSKPAIRANVNGRSYLFDINLPGLGPGLRKILVVTNLQKICAVDVDTYETWLLRMKRGRGKNVVGARWAKLTHQKLYKDRTKSPVNLKEIRQQHQIKQSQEFQEW